MQKNGVIWLLEAGEVKDNWNTTNKAVSHSFYNINLCMNIVKCLLDVISLLVSHDKFKQTKFTTSYLTVINL